MVPSSILFLLSVMQKKVENHAPGSLVHLAEINSNTQSNYQTVVNILPEKSAIDSLSSAYAVMRARRLNSSQFLTIPAWKILAFVQCFGADDTVLMWLRNSQQFKAFH